MTTSSAPDWAIAMADRTIADVQRYQNSPTELIAMLASRFQAIREYGVTKGLELASRQLDRNDMAGAT
jgi:hypothetical protein